MKRAVEATLLHMTSTDSAPNHSKCPDGAESWCKYNRALANGEDPPAHKNPLPDCVRVALEPVFARLSNEDLLARCSDGMSQNASESLHSVIWTQTSKNSNASLISVKRAVAEAVAVVFFLPTHAVLPLPERREAVLGVHRQRRLRLFLGLLEQHEELQVSTASVIPYCVYYSRTLLMLFSRDQKKRKNPAGNARARKPEKMSAMGNCT